MSYIRSEVFSSVTPFVGKCIATEPTLTDDGSKSSGANLLVLGVVEAAICLGIAAAPLAWIAGAFLPTIAH